MAFQNSTSTYEWHTESTHFKESTYGTDSTFVEVIRVRRKNGAAFNLQTDPNVMRSELIIPHPMASYITGTPTITNRNLGGMRCQSIDHRPDSTGKTLTTTITYVAKNYADNIKANAVIFPSSTSYQTAVRSAKQYRTGWTVVPPLGADTSADIGGTAIGGAGATLSEQIPQLRIKLKITQDASQGSSSYMDAVAQTLLAYVGCINNATFAGFAAGSVICEGFALNPTTLPYFEATMDFLWDELAHHDQVAETGADGRVNWLGSNVKTVIWQRIPRPGIDFNLIFSGDTNFRDRTLRGVIVP
jgi:hypothetical protein